MKAALFLMVVQHLVFRALSVGFSLWAITSGRTWVIIVALVLFALEYFQLRGVTGNKPIAKVYNFILVLPVLSVFVIHPWWLGILETGLIVQAINTLVAIIASIYFAVAMTRGEETTTETEKTQV